MKQNEKVRKGGFSKKDHIKYWIDTANRDWIAIRKMLEGRSYIHSLFFMHLVLEKLLKAHWVKDNSGNHPPKIHDLIRLSSQINLKLSKDQMRFLIEMNEFQLEGRYPDHAKRLVTIYRKKKTYIIFTSVNEIRRCLLKGLL